MLSSYEHIPESQVVLPPLRPPYLTEMFGVDTGTCGVCVNATIPNEFLLNDADRLKKATCTALKACHKFK